MKTVIGLLLNMKARFIRCRSWRSSDNNPSLILLDVVEKIQSVETQRGDRPCEDIKILKTDVL